MRPPGSTRHRRRGRAGFGGSWAGVLLVSLSMAIPVDAAQPDATVQQFRRAHDTAERSKRQLAATMLAIVADLAGTDGDEGYRLRGALDDLEAALTRWHGAVDTMARLVGPEGAAGPRLVLARAYFDAHRLEEARRELQRALALAPGRPDGLRLAALIALAEGRPARAVDVLHALTRAAPDDAAAAYWLAEVAETIGRPADAATARRAFVDAAERHLAGLWTSPVARLGDRTRADVLARQQRFPVRVAPVDMLARVGGGPAGFLPETYDAAARRVASGDYARALGALREALDADPLTRDIPTRALSPEAAMQAAAGSGRAAAYVALGHALMAAGRAREAGPAFARAVELNPALTIPRLRLASRALSEQDAVAAHRHLDAALRRDPTSVEARRLRGQAYRMTRDTASAVTELEAAQALGPAAPVGERLQTAIQMVLLSTPGDDGVERAMAAAVEAHPRSGAAYQNLARFLRSIGRNPEAVTAYRHALERYPLVATTGLHMRIAEIHLDQLRSEAAMAAARGALTLDPNDTGARAFIARLLLEANRLDDAYVEYLAVLLVDPLNADAHARVAQIRLQQRDFPAAVGAARRAVLEDPAHAQARYTLGQALLRSGAADEGRRELAEYTALQATQEERARRQRELDSLNQEASALAGSGQLARAVALLRRAVELDPSGQSHANLGLALMQMGQVDDAIVNFERAAALADRDPLLRLYLAEAYQEAGRSQESARARAEYERLRAGQPPRN